MKIGAEKTRLMVSKVNGIQRELRVKGQKLGTLTDTLELLSQMMASNMRLYQGLNKVPQPYPSLSQFVEVTPYYLQDQK